MTFGADQCTHVVITQQIQVDLIFIIHCGIKHCADVSKWKYQHIHCDSISNGIIQLNPHMAPRGEPSHHTDPRQRNGYAHMTSLDSYTKLIRSCDIDTRTIVRTLHLCPQLLGNDIQSPKSLDMSVEVILHFISHPLGNYIQIVKPLYMSVEKKCQDFSYASPRVTDKDSGIEDDTFTLGKQCHGCLHTPRSRQTS